MTQVSGFGTDALTTTAEKYKAEAPEKRTWNLSQVQIGPRPLSARSPENECDRRGDPLARLVVRQPFLLSLRL